MKKILLAFASVALLAVLIPAAFASGCVRIPPGCHCVPGRTPGYWKHNIGVYCGEANGAYSWYFDSVKLNDATVAYILSRAGVTCDEALEALSAQGYGSEAIRNYMNFRLNWAANLNPFYLI
jgi:hypothetical protein